ncbi:TonB-dependent receptor plug domain-containing protein [Roseovarius aestuarii]|nr:TonB-dependent receptor plug domain-containing protein [Roseovarius aestuarii]
MVFRTLNLSTLIVSTVGVTAGMAQQADDVVDLGPIYLKSDTDLSPVGTSPAETIDSDRIGARQASSITDAIRDVPGVTVRNSENLLVATPGIRGIGGASYNGGDPGVQVQVDGVDSGGGRVYQNATGAIIDPVLLKSITVLKGPLASLAYGSGIIGGTVNAETINGSDLTGDEPGVKFRQLLGANSNGEGFVSSSTMAWQPNEKFDFLLNYSWRKQGVQEDGNGNDIGLDGYKVPSWLAKARYRINDEHSISLSYSQSESSERDVPYGQLTGTNVFGNVDRDRQSKITNAKWNFDSLDTSLVNLELSYTHSEQLVDIRALDPTSFAALFGGTYNLDTDRVKLINTAEFSTGGIQHQLQAGVDWQRQVRDDVSSLLPSGEMQRLGIFALDQMDFGNGFHVSLGLRVDRQEIHGDTYAGPGMTIPTGKFKGTAKTAGIGIEQGFGNGFAAFGSYTYSETLPTLDVFAQTSLSRGTIYGDEVQKNRNLEAGLKFSRDSVFSNNDSLRFVASVYQTKIRNSLFGVARSGEYTDFDLRGFEIEADYEHASGIFGRAAANISDHSQLFYNAGAGYVSQDYSYTPADSVSLTLGKRWDSGWQAAWTMRAADDINLNGTKYSGWSTHDLLVRYAPHNGALEGFTVDFKVGNMFDRHYQDNLASQPEPGRNFGLTVAKTF